MSFICESSERVVSLLNPEKKFELKVQKIAQGKDKGREKDSWSKVWTMVLTQIYLKKQLLQKNLDAKC